MNYTNNDDTTSNDNSIKGLAQSYSAKQLVKVLEDVRRGSRYYNTVYDIIS